MHCQFINSSEFLQKSAPTILGARWSGQDDEFKKHRREKEEPRQKKKIERQELNNQKAKQPRQTKEKKNETKQCESKVSNLRHTETTTCPACQEASSHVIFEDWIQYAEFFDLVTRVLHCLRVPRGFRLRFL